MTPIVAPPHVPLLKTSEAAHALGVSTRTINTWAASGKLHSTRTPGGQHRYDRGEIAVVAAELGCAWPTLEREPARWVEDYREAS